MPERNIISVTDCMNCGSSGAENKVQIETSFPALAKMFGDKISSRIGYMCDKCTPNEGEHMFGRFKEGNK